MSNRQTLTVEEYRVVMIALGGLRRESIEAVVGSDDDEPVSDEDAAFYRKRIDTIDAAVAKIRDAMTTRTVRSRAFPSKTGTGVPA